MGCVFHLDTAHSFTTNFTNFTDYSVVDNYSLLYFYFEVVLQFLLSLAVVVGNVADDMSVL